MKHKLSMLIVLLTIVMFFQNANAQLATKPVVQKASTSRYIPKSQYSPKKTRTYYRADTVKNTDFTLNGQYQFLLSRSKTINGYKLINTGKLSGVWKSVSDTLRKERAELQKTKATLTAQDKNISNLQREINGNENSLSTSNAKINEITFLGIAFEKGTYNIIVWSIILLLALALIIVILRSAKNIIEAKHRTGLYEEISAEYQAFKTKSNEQQRKLARELQDERNIIDELKNRG